MDEKLEKYIRSVALPIDTKLGDLKIKAVIGVGSTGIVYEAYDRTTQRVIALKEYFPVRLAQRRKNLSVEPSNPENKAAFQAGLNSFLEKGIQLSRVRHPNIVQLLKVEEQNNTVYLLMEKIDGPLLAERLGAGHFIAPDVINGWVEKILDAIKYIHDNGILHLAIDPSNIIISDRLGPVLIDFGEITDGLKNDQKIRDNPYRAVELISGSRDNIGKPTDIYAAGAIFAHLISGTAPIPASSRSSAKTDPQTHISGDTKLRKNYSKNLLESVDNALAIKAESRHANIDDWLNAISQQAVSKSRRDKRFVYLASGLVIALIATWLGFGRSYYAEYKAWTALPADDFCSAKNYIANYPNGRYLQEASTRVEVCELNQQASLKASQAEKQKQLRAILGTMIPISAPACFSMGSPITENGRGDNERQHEVCIQESYELSAHEVTVGQFRKFVKETSYKTDAETNKENLGCWALAQGDEDAWEYKSWASWQNPYKNHPVTDAHPVSCVSINDISHFFTWLNTIADTQYRLPTEAEWEFAVRGKSDPVARPWGESPRQACVYANVADLTNIPALTGLHSNTSPWPSHHNCRDTFLYSAPVGNFKPNHNGFYDLLGNVWELTCSAFSGSYGDLETECATEEGNRADRGGGWDSGPNHARSAARGDISYFARGSNIGFRIARSL